VCYVNSLEVSLSFPEWLSLYPQGLPENIFTTFEEKPLELDTFKKVGRVKKYSSKAKEKSVDAASQDSTPTTRI